MMLKKWMAATALGFCLSGMVWAEDTQKLGFIDTGRVYRESLPAQAVQNKLEKEFSVRQNALQRMQKEGLALKTQIESGKIPAADRERKVREMLEMDQAYKQKAAELAEDYNLRRNEEFASLQQQANRVIVRLAEQNGYDIILQDAVFVNGKFDITDQVIKALNAGK